MKAYVDKRESLSERHLKPHTQNCDQRYYFLIKKHFQENM